MNFVTEALKKTTTAATTKITKNTTTRSNQSSYKAKTPISKKNTAGTCELTKIVLCRHSFQEQHECIKKCLPGRVSIQGVESLWGDCRFIPADWGS